MKSQNKPPAARLKAGERTIDMKYYATKYMMGAGEVLLAFDSRKERDAFCEQDYTRKVTASSLSEHQKESAKMNAATIKRETAVLNQDVTVATK
jgi:hypothetical protein